MDSINNNSIDKDFLAFIAKVAHNAILVLDAKGKILWANKGFISLYGYSIDEYNGLKNNSENSFISIVHEVSPEFFINNSALTLSRVIFTKNNERKWVQSTITPFKSAEQGTLNFIVIDADITQQKEVEEELRQRQENTQTLSEHLESVKDYVEDQIKELNEQKKVIELAKEKSEEVLNKVLPYEVAIQLKRKGYATPRNYKKVTLMHLSIRNFLSLANVVPIEKLVEQLHQVFVTIDSILEQHYVEKIKTIGGNYLGAGGVPLRNRSNPIDVALAALKIKESIKELNAERKNSELPEFDLSFGIHTGKAIAGVVGKNKLSYDIWGDTVNISATVERNTETGKVMVTSDTCELINEYFICEEKGNILYENNGEIKLYEVLGLKPEFTDDAKGISPNQTFLHLLSKL